MLNVKPGSRSHDFRQLAQRLAELVGERLGGGDAGEVGDFEGEEALCALGGGGDRLGGAAVEAALVDREGGLVGGADPGALVERGLGTGAAAGQLLHQSEHAPQLRDLRAGIGEAGKGLGRPGLRHDARIYRAGAKEGLMRRERRLRRGRGCGRGGG